jgi:hypothetical protein
LYYIFIYFSFLTPNRKDRLLKAAVGSILFYREVMFLELVVESGWYLLIPFLSFFAFMFIPDFVANWLNENEYLIIKKRVQARMYLKSVSNNFINSINVSLYSNTFTYEYQS